MASDLARIQDFNTALIEQIIKDDQVFELEVTQVSAMSQTHKKMIWDWCDEYIDRYDVRFPLEALTELGNLNRFRRVNYEKILFITEIDRWYEWEGKSASWREGDDIARKSYNRMLQDILDEHNRYIRFLEIYLTCDEPQYMEREGRRVRQFPPNYNLIKSMTALLMKWFEKSQTYARKAGCLKHASDTIPFITHYDTFDSKPYYFGFYNGRLDIRTGELHKHDPSFLAIKRTFHEYIPEWDCPNFKRDIWRQMSVFDERGNILEGETRARVEYMKRVFGACMLGTKKNIMVIMVGLPATGKTTLVNTILEALQKEYAQAIATQTLLGTNGSNNQYYLSSLKGLRMVVINETRAEQKLAEELFKELLDSGGITARNPYGKPFTFSPVCTPILTTNEIPNIGIQNSVWRRIDIVEFKNTITGPKRTNYIEEEYREEWSGILNWMLEGAREYITLNGFNPPQSIQDATLEHKDEQDYIGEYIKARCIKDPTMAQSKSLTMVAMMEDMNMWLKTVGLIGFSLQNPRHLKSKLVQNGWDVRAIGGAGNKLIGYRLATLGDDIMKKKQLVHDNDLLDEIAEG